MMTQMLMMTMTVDGEMNKFNSLSQTLGCQLMDQPRGITTTTPVAAYLVAGGSATSGWGTAHVLPVHQVSSWNFCRQTAASLEMMSGEF